MTLANIVALAIATFLLALVPGPGVMATVARALASGFKPATAVIGGIVVGDLLFLLAAIYGLSYVASMLGGLFVAVKYLGGAYLIWLGVSLLRSTGTKAPQNDRSPPEPKSRLDFLSGLAVTLGNPKVIVFYLSFLPAFMDLKTLTGWDVLVIASVVSIVLGGVLSFYAFAAARARSLMSNDRFTKRINQTAGGILIGSGSLMIAKSP